MLIAISRGAGRERRSLVFAVSKLAMSQTAGCLQIYATAYHNGWPEELRSSFGEGTPHRCE
jgi:hypothetical protein